MTSAEADARTIAELRAALVTGRVVQCVGIDWPSRMGSFNVNGGNQNAPLFGVPPIVGEDALLVYFAGQPFCFGPRVRAPWGVVESAPASGKVGVVFDDEAHYSLPYADTLSLILGDRVAADWAAQVVYGEPASETEDADVPVPGGGGSQVKQWTFYPTGSGSFLNGSGSPWTDQVWCSDSNVGMFAYGTQIADTIPATADIRGVSVHLEVESQSGGAPSIGLHSQTGVALPTITDAVSIGFGSGDFALPNAFGDQFKTGAKRGLGTNHGGRTVYSRANANNCGALTITAIV